MVEEMRLFDYEISAEAQTALQLFKDWKVKAEEIFTIMEVTKPTSYEFVRQYHYLGNAKFFALYSYGLWCEGELVGIAAFSLPQGTSASEGWFGKDANDKSVLELTRLAMLPMLNNTNATSYLLSHSMKMLHKDHGVKAVITLADASRHVGSIYQVCNFKYYGLADDKSDFYRYPSGKKNVRGSTNGMDGVWIARTKKHRYAYIMDKSLRCLYQEQTRPTKANVFNRYCCGGTGVVEDKRTGCRYTCPICTGKLLKL